MNNKNVVHYFIDGVTKNFVNFSGRARRKEFWSITLFFFLSMFLAALTSEEINYESSSSLLFGIFAFFFFPLLSAAVRRMHDIGKSGTNLLFYFIPVIGGLWVLVLLLTASDYGTNRYGRNPKKPALGKEIDQIGEE